VVEAAPAEGISNLTLYAFSSDNWKRPPAEVRQLLRLFLRYLRTETAKCREQGVALHVIGRRDRLPDVLRRAIEDAEAETAGGRVLQLRLAIDYSAQDAIVRASAALARQPATRAQFSAALAAVLNESSPVPDVDLLIRTGGEQRLSDFLLWECAYAELYFTPRCWPEFDAAALREALAAYGERVRRFGGLDAVRGRALRVPS
jgi:undecaprenyl diphosphate synthase